MTTGTSSPITIMPLFSFVNTYPAIRKKLEKCEGFEEKAGGNCWKEAGEKAASRAHVSAFTHPRSVSLERGDIIANGLDACRDRHRQHQPDGPPKPAPEHHGKGHGECAQLDAAPD